MEDIILDMERDQLTPAMDLMEEAMEALQAMVAIVVLPALVAMEALLAIMAIAALTALAVMAVTPVEDTEVPLALEAIPDQAMAHHMDMESKACRKRLIILLFCNSILLNNSILLPFHSMKNKMSRIF